MERLGKKLKSELKTGARVISNVYTFPTWSQSKKEDNVYLYEQWMTRSVRKGKEDGQKRNLSRDQKNQTSEPVFTLFCYYFVLPSDFSNYAF